MRIFGKNWSHRTSVLLLFSALSLGSMAQQSAEPWNAPAFSAAPQDLLKAASGLAAPGDTQVLVLLEEQRFTLDEQGRAIETWRMVFRPLTPQAAEDWSVIGAEWSPWHQERPVIRVRVITPKGGVHSLDPKTISETPVATNEPNVFTDRRSLRAPLPAIEAGAVVEEEVVTRDTAPLFEAGVVHRGYLARAVPIHRRRILVDAPATLPLRYIARLVPESAIQREEVGGRVKVSVEIGPINPPDQTPPHLPLEVPDTPQFSFATGRSWREVAARFSEVIDRQIRVADVEAFVRPSVGTKDRLQLARELTVRLHKEVRYTGVEFGEAEFVPRPPAETLQRKYGDCKDKAALLIAMLRSAGMSAYMALLSTDDDAEPDLPGIGDFDHAIVYAPGSPDIWIDATSEFARASELPTDDQGRLALILRPDTEKLVRTPEASPEENRLVETREFYLAERGKARVVETTEAWGAAEQGYRSSYGGPDSKETRQELEKYLKDYYFAEALTRFEHGEGSDLSKPFRMTLEAAKASRGNSGESDAAVGIFPWQIAQRLPSEFFDDANDSDPAGKDGPSPLTGKAGGTRTADLVLPQAFVTEWHYRIVPPPGFRARKLPAGGEMRLGPAVLTSDFAGQPDGVVTATLRFSSGKRHMTFADALALRKAIRELRKAPATLIYFDQVGEQLLAAGKILEALGAFKELAGLHPTEALHHTQTARALLAAGLGEAARAQAREAIRVEPQASLGHQALGWILQHDLVGRRFKKGFDLEAALAAYHKAKELEPKNQLARADLAILLEYNSRGVRYGPGSKLDEAIAEYRALEKESEDFNLHNNLAFALLWSKRFSELKEFLVRIPANDTRNALNIAAIAASEGPRAAIAKAAEITSDSSRRTALQNAGSYLLQIRFYPQAAEMLGAAARGAADAANLLSRAEFFRNVKRYEDLQLSDSDPRGTASKFMVGSFLSDSLDQFVENSFSRHARDEWKNPRAQRRTRASFSSGRAAFSRSGMPAEVGVDLFLGVTQMAVEGEDAGGYRVRLQSPFGTSNQGTRMTLLLVREEGKLRVLDTSPGVTYLGKQVLEQVEKGDLAGARRWLDWAREDLQLVGGEDPLAGAVFPRLWVRGAEAGRDEIRAAAASIIASSEDAKLVIPILQELREGATNDSARLNLDLALATALTKEERFADLIPVSERLLAVQPKSDTAFRFLMAGLMGTKRWTECEQAAQQRLKLIPDDALAIRMLAQNAIYQSKFDEAQKILQRLMDLGKAEAEDYNGMAWYSLFQGPVTPEAIQTAQRATTMTQNASFPSLHTLAALYAEVGKTSEARDVLLQAMEVQGLEEPDSESWYVFGRIAEQFGEKDAALSAYRRVEKPDGEVHPIATYVLAQRRIAAIGR